MVTDQLLCLCHTKFVWLNVHNHLIANYTVYICSTLQTDGFKGSQNVTTLVISSHYSLQAT